MAGNEVILLNRGCMGEPYVIENVCFVGSDESVDITIEQGRIADVRSSEKSVDKASKTWVIRHARPGPVRGRHAVQTLPVGR